MTTAASPAAKAQSRRREERHDGFLRHGDFRYARIAGAVCVAAVGLYVVVDVAPRHNGGSWLGYLYGAASAGLIVWLTALGWRKRAITPGAWSLKGWTSAHVYLGLALLVVATLHTGFQFGWNVHTLAYGLMVLVIASGVVGLSFYATVPRRMSDNRGEMGSAQMLEEIAGVDAELREAAQPLEEPFAGWVRAAIEETRIIRGPIARLRAEPKDCATRRALEAVRAEAAARPAARDAPRTLVLALLERKQALLRRARKHARFRALLEIWLYVHVPVTFALLAALIAHIVSVFYFW